MSVHWNAICFRRIYAYVSKWLAFIMRNAQWPKCTIWQNQTVLHCNYNNFIGDICQETTIDSHINSIDNWATIKVHVMNLLQEGWNMKDWCFLLRGSFFSICSFLKHYILISVFPPSSSSSTSHLSSVL